jgi:AhpD family alkylhydroperoxidase
MSRLSVPNLESDSSRSGQIYAQIKKAIGSVPKTFAAIAAHGPAALRSVLAAGTLSKHDQEVIKPVISGAAECDYCVAAHNYLAGSAMRWSASSASSRSPAVPVVTRISPRSRLRATATPSWWRSTWHSRPTSSTASTTPRSTSLQSPEATCACQISNMKGLRP